MAIDVNFIDYHIQGKVDFQGNLIEYTGKEAVENAMRFWLTSFPNDYLRKSETGGFLTSFLAKPMGEGVANQIATALNIGFRKEFNPPVTISSIEVIPVYD